MWLFVYSLLLIYVNIKCVCVKILNCTACNWQTFVMIILLLIYIFTMTFVHYYSKVRLQCFLPSVLWCCWLGSRKGIRPVKNLSGGVLAWLSFWSKMQTCIWPNWCHCHSLFLASVKSRLVLPFWYRLTRVVPDKGPLNRCVCVQ